MEIEPPPLDEAIQYMMLMNASRSSSPQLGDDTDSASSCSGDEQRDRSSSMEERPLERSRFLDLESDNETPPFDIPAIPLEMDRRPFCVFAQ